jgi:DNA-binding CsgD family transcriptional regulator
LRSAPSEKSTISCQGRTGCSIFVLHQPTGERPFSEPVEPAPPAPRRDRSPAARRAARQKRAEREARIVDLLNRGVSVAEIADRDGVGERAMRKTIRTLLARRTPAPPAEFLALQVSRLNEALLVAYDAMSVVNLEAVDRVVKIVRELDRYHGFAVAAEAATPRQARLAPPSSAPLALAAPRARMEQLAPQPIEIAQFASRNGAPSR